MQGQTAIAEIVGRHQAALFRYLRLLGAEHHEANDLAQEAFVTLFTSMRRGKFQAQAQAATFAWLRRVAKNKLISARRKRGEVSLGEIEALDQAWESLSPAGLQEARLARLEKCREDLPERPATVLHLRYDLNLSSDEIASRMASSAEAVRSLLKRARASLRECMEQHQEHQDEQA